MVLLPEYGSGTLEMALHLNLSRPGSALTNRVWEKRPYNGSKSFKEDWQLLPWSLGTLSCHVRSPTMVRSPCWKEAQASNIDVWGGGRWGSVSLQLFQLPGITVISNESSDPPREQTDWDFPGGSVIGSLPSNAGEVASIPA